MVENLSKAVGVLFIRARALGTLTPDTRALPAQNVENDRQTLLPCQLLPVLPCASNNLPSPPSFYPFAVSVAQPYRHTGKGKPSSTTSSKPMEMPPWQTLILICIFRSLYLMM
jgi:hypothetical protein